MAKARVSVTIVYEDGTHMIFSGDMAQGNYSAAARKLRLVVNLDEDANDASKPDRV